MKQIRKVLTAVFFLGLLIVVVTACSSDAEPQVIDPSVVEHNPQEIISPAPTEPPVEEEPEDSERKPDEEDTVTQAPTPTEALPEYVVVLDPGHGGKFTGAMYNGLIEKDVALKLAVYAKEYLETYYPQLSVHLTREEDMEFDAELAKDLENRVQLGKELGADVFVSLHLNASAAHNIQGAEVLCPHRENVKEESFFLANAILDELAELGLKRRGIVTRNSNDTVDENGNPVEYYAINRHAANRNMIGIIIEHCFMDNETDQKYLADDEALRRLAEADARGIAAYFGYDAPAVE